MPLPLANQSEPIPGYKLIERLGAGGFGEVWKAEAPGGMLKAIKFVHGDLRDGTEQGSAAEQELKALNRVKSVRHPFILSLERADVIEGQLVIVMELADRDLMGRFRECTGAGLTGIPRKELLRYLEEAAEALDLMNHDYGLQHLDIKPQNLFLVHNHVKVADFGLVKDLEGMRAAVTGGVTPLYSSPETFEGWVSNSSDQYSLAIVFQELLTGKRPFNGTNPRMLLMQHLMQPPDMSLLSEADRVVIGKALSKKPDERYPSCGAMVRCLIDAESKPSKATRTRVPLPPKSAIPPENAMAATIPKPRAPEPVSKDVLSYTPPRQTPRGPDTAGPTAEPPKPKPPSGTMILARCPSCGHQGNVPEKFKGQQVKCRGCGNAFAVGVAASAKPAPPPAAQTIIAPAESGLDVPENIGLKPMEGEEELAIAAETAAESEEVINADAVIVVPTLCPGCQFKGFVPEKFIGRRVKCRECRQSFTVLDPKRKSGPQPRKRS